MIFEFEKKKIKNYLNEVSPAPFQVKLFDGDSFTIGEGDPFFTIKINRELKKSDLLCSTSLALGEAFMDKDIEVEGDLFTALNVIMSQFHNFSVDTHALKKLLHSSTSAKNQKKEVTSHYDIGNDFYKLWLGKTMNYSCAYFKTAEDTLDEAQQNKIDLILQKLYLKEGMSLLDIGCGWGFLLIEAAKKYRVHGVGITLSEEQAKGFRDKIKAENLEDLIEVKILDYRELEKSKLTFDRIVSVGMIEHVGRENYDLFLRNADSVLKPGGLFLLHYISALQEHPGDPWIKKYIFPGGVIPSLREIIQLCGDHRFYTIDVESLRRHYVKTLLCWYDNYLKAEREIANMFDERFMRMWALYLCSCAASFNNGVIDLHQILISKGPNNDLPLTPWW